MKIFEIVYTGVFAVIIWILILTVFLPALLIGLGLDYAFGYKGA
jgi:hypothetical protein